MIFVHTVIIIQFKNFDNDILCISFEILRKKSHLTVLIGLEMACKKTE
jgi:hypothetical protein